MAKNVDRLREYQYRPKTVDVLTPEQAAYLAKQGVDIRAEYAVLRKRANQRLRDLAAAGFGKSDVYRDWVNRLPTLIEIGSGTGMDTSLLYDAIAEATRFLAMKRSTVGGYNEYLERTAHTFARHYGKELPEMEPELFGELMRSIKAHASAESYYRGWQTAYRKVLSNAKRAGLTQDQLIEAVQNGEISIGAKGGLKDDATGRYITRQWEGMGP